MHEAAIEEMIGSSIWIGFIKAPSWLALGVWSNDRGRKEVLKVFDVSDEVNAVSKGTEETCLCL